MLPLGFTFPPFLVLCADCAGWPNDGGVFSRPNNAEQGTCDRCSKSVWVSLGIGTLQRSRIKGGFRVEVAG